MKRRDWDGSRAYRELRKTGLLWFLHPDDEGDHSYFELLTKKLWKEIQTYRTFREKIIPSNECFRDALERLTAVESRLRKRHFEQADVKVELEGVLEKAAAYVEKCKLLIERKRSEYWKLELLAPSHERRQWKVFLDREKIVQPIPPEDVVQYEKLFDGVKYPKELVKRLDLDSRLQIRVGIIFRSVLPVNTGISLMTISRLVALTYICGKIAEDKKGDLFIAGTDRRLSITLIYQRLGGAGLK